MGIHPPLGLRPVGGGVLKRQTFVGPAGLRGDEQDRGVRAGDTGLPGRRHRHRAECVDLPAQPGGQTLSGALEAFDTVGEGFLADVRATDPGAAMTAPPAPWDGVYEPTESVQRFVLGHLAVELARHAGHADIVREQIDGATAGALLMAVHGVEGDDFGQPWTPARRSTHPPPWPRYMYDGNSGHPVWSIVGAVGLLLVPVPAAGRARSPGRRSRPAPGR